MADKWILIQHPDFENEPHRVPQSAFDNLHIRKGWVVVGEEDETVTEPTPIPKPPKKKTAKPTDSTPSDS